MANSNYQPLESKTITYDQTLAERRLREAQEKEDRAHHMLGQAMRNFELIEEKNKQFIGPNKAIVVTSEAAEFLKK